MKPSDTEQAAALQHIDLAIDSASAPDYLEKHKAAVPLLKNRRAAVVGGGTMGAGIAYALLNANFKVVLIERDQSTVDAAQDRVDQIISASLQRRFITEAEARERRSCLTLTRDFNAASDASIAIEAVIENMESKKSVIRQLQQVMSETTTLATNTSYLDINELASVLSEPGRLIGLHFFAPAHIMKLLEIVRGEFSNPAALASGYALAKALKKVPVVASVCDGFIGNRILARYREAADTLLLDGSTPWSIDQAMVKFGYPMGPYEAQDLSGLDIAHTNRRRQDSTRDQNRRYVSLGDQLVERGRLGKKTGAGWYRYPDQCKQQDPVVMNIVVEEAQGLGIERVNYDAEIIREQLTLAMINEASNVLYEGIASCSDDIDLVSVLGYGFPRWRGGLMYYADSLGIPQIVDRLHLLAQHDPIVWKISPLILDCADKGVSIAEWRNT